MRNARASHTQALTVRYSTYFLWLLEAESSKASWTDHLLGASEAFGVVIQVRRKRFWFDRSPLDLFRNIQVFHLTAQVTGRYVPSMNCRLGSSDLSREYSQVVQDQQAVISDDLREQEEEDFEC